MRKAALLFFLAAIALLMASCAGQIQFVSNSTGDPPPGPTAGNAPVGLSVTDTPPAGVTVLFFQLSIKSATLTNSSGESVSLWGSTLEVPVNVSQLQADSAFLRSQNVPAGTYTSLSATFFNPQLTIYNGTGAAIGSCLSGEFCEGTVPISPLTLTFSSAPFPLTLAAKSPVDLTLDIHLNEVIQPDLTLNLAAANGVTVTQSTPPSAGKAAVALGKLRGITQSLGTNQFVLQNADTRTFTILVDSDTQYIYPSTLCPAEDFSCVATEQTLDVQLALQSDGTLLATEVRYLQPSTQSSFEGNIVSLGTSGGNTVIDLVMQDNTGGPGQAPLGRLAVVTIPNSGVNYAVDSGSFVIPSGLTFGGVSDLRIGQEILATPQGAVVWGPLPAEGPGWNSAHIDGANFTASSLTLEPSQLTGTVTEISAGALTFILRTSPSFFLPLPASGGTPPSPTPVSITVQTTGATAFANLTPDAFSGLALNNVVSVRGWLFPSTVVPLYCTASGGCYPTTTLAADAVVGRTAAAALF